jgi:amidase
VWGGGGATAPPTPDADIARWQAAAEAAGPGKVPYLEQMVKGCRLSHREWLGLNNERMKLRRQFNAFFADWDIVLCPAAASAAWPHDQAGERWQRTIPVNGKRVPTTDQLFWAGYSCVVYLPSTVGPAGLTRSGLPVGYQAIAASGRDKWATAFSRLVEREIGGFTAPPGYE